MNRIPVTSSNVTAVGWEADPDGDAGTLEVEFHSGHVYQYDRVPEEVFEELRGASSVGKFMNQRIIGTYDESRVR